MGSDESGEYSLKVSNATLEDDAVYECQVGPATNNRPIRASARLNVMRKYYHVLKLSIFDTFLKRCRVRNILIYDVFAKALNHMMQHRRRDQTFLLTFCHGSTPVSNQSGP